MTTIRVWNSSASNGPGTSSDWSDAYHTVDGARAGQSLGSSDIIMVHTGTTPHLESVAAVIDWTGPINSPPLTVIGVDKDNSDAYNVATTYIFITTGVNDISLDGAFAVYGLWFQTGDDISLSADSTETNYFKDCKFKVPGTVGEDVNLPHTGYFVDCIFDLGSLGAVLTAGSFIEFINPTFIGAANDGILDPIGSRCDVDVIGGDFTSTDTEIFNSGDASSHRASFVGCVEHASYTMIRPSSAAVNEIFHIDGSDTVAGNNQWRVEKIQSTNYGAIYLSDTVYRSSGECTYDGSTEYSKQYTTGANIHLDCPVIGDWNSMYVAAADGKNLKVYIASTASVDNSEVWLEVEYFSSTSNTLKIVSNSRINTPLTSPTTCPTATGETWVAITESPTGGQYLTLPSTIDIKKSGMLRWRVTSAASNDVYVCMDAELV